MILTVVYKIIKNLLGYQRFFKSLYALNVAMELFIH